MKLPATMMEMLRGRFGLDEDDITKDAEIEKLSPVEIVRECAAWKLGDQHWANVVARWMKAAEANPKDFG